MPERWNHPADLLDRFSESLRTNRQAPAPEPLDADVADTARAIERATREANPDRAAMERVWQAIDSANGRPEWHQQWASPSRMAPLNGNVRRVDEIEHAPEILKPPLQLAAPTPVRTRRRTREVLQLVAELALLVAGAGLLVLLFRGSGEQAGNVGDGPATITAQARVILKMVPDWRVSGATLDGSVLGGIGLAPDGTMYVADLANSRILHLRADGSMISSFSAPGSGTGALHLYPGVHLSGLAVDSAGNIYVPDYGNSRIQIFAKDGSHLATWDTTGGVLALPSAVAVDGDDNVFVVDYAMREDLWRVLKFDHDGNLLLSIDRDENGEDRFGNLSSIAVDGDGNLYICDVRANRILKFDRQGRFLLAWGGSGSGPGLFNEPSSIAVDGDGTVFVTDAFNFRVQRFDSNGQYLGEWSDTAQGNKRLDRPFSVAVGSDGEVYVVDIGNTLHRFRLIAP